MVDIKFRAWHKLNKRMHYNVQDTFCVQGLGDCFGDILSAPSKFEVMMYTGLKDKNGKEIYEGDIVSAKYIYDKRTTDKAQVIWREDKASFGLKSLKGLTNEEYELYKITAEHNLEVIGNIYENPELLNKLHYEYRPNKI